MLQIKHARFWNDQWACDWGQVLKALIVDPKFNTTKATDENDMTFLKLKNII